MSTPTLEHPIVIEHRRLHERAGSFTPAAVAIVTATLRHGGLLSALTDEQSRAFLALLTFVSPNGVVQAIPLELSQALSVPEASARKRLDQLTKVMWEGEPIVHRLESENGLVLYALGATVAGHSEEAIPAALNAPIEGAGREAVIAASRESYSRPREEVEREIALQLGHTPEELADTPEGEVRRRLLALGVLASEVDDLLAQHTLAEIWQQLEWLPSRQPRHPQKLIVAAIREGYEPPQSWTDKGSLSQVLSALPEEGGEDE